MIGFITNIIPFGSKILDLLYAKRDNERMRKEVEEWKKEKEALNKELKRARNRIKKLEKYLP